MLTKRAVPARCSLRPSITTYMNSIVVYTTRLQAH